MHVPGLILLALLPVVSSSLPAAETPENVRLQIQLIPEPGAKPEEGVRRRLVQGKNIQAMILIPDGLEKNGSLLDPDSVSVTWNDESVDHFVFYKAPHIALLFALVHDDKVTTESQLSMTGRLHGSDDLDAGWRLPINFTEEEMQQMASRPVAKGRGVRVMDVEGEPIAGAYVFGQRREDLLTKTDEHGLAILDAPARSSMETHFAWAEDYWTTFFDPISTSIVKLVPWRGNSFIHEVMLDIRDEEGEPVTAALFYVNDNYYQIYHGARRTKLLLEENFENHILVIAPGFQPERISIGGRDRGKRVVLRDWKRPE